jgi:excinuclease ABC subunit A
LATQIGSVFIGVLYWMSQVLVYTKEITKIHSLEQLRDIGNSVIVVEHKDMIERADYVIDIGPKLEIRW